MSKRNTFKVRWRSKINRIIFGIISAGENSRNFVGSSDKSFGKRQISKISSEVP